MEAVAWPHSLAHDCPNHRLRVETVAQGQAALRRLFEESVEESKGMLIQRRLVRALLWLVVSGTVVGIAEGRNLEWRVPLNVQPH